MFLIALLVQNAIAKKPLTYTIKGTHNGRPIDSAELVLEPFPPGLDRLNFTSAFFNSPPLISKRDYSPNWCGASQHTQTANKYTSIHTLYQIPTLTWRSGQSGNLQYFAAWLGIDGATWTSTLLQAGTASVVRRFEILFSFEHAA
jgi:hypothetical protein